ncbi:Endonuclease-reverse transcriptase [Operophtera brumata]|uniref:Endonuclease-reverse transcriptase n=1 Tax=Operophtera brumata TaxID=104452 RepID=A0A0L7LKR7_OPEBR|nr:Endonuclease-reverse transcriptase [Operophtera brumata]
MDANFEKLFVKIRIEMQLQTKEITENLMIKMDEKLQPLVEENCKLKQKVELLEKKVEILEREKKKNNLMIFGLEETERSNFALVEAVVQEINNLGVKLEIQEINKVQRVGQKQENGRARPITLTLTNSWKRIEILKNKKNSNKIYITEDFPKPILEIRRSLQQKLVAERNKGNYAYISYDKLVVKENKQNEKSKRSPTRSPQEGAAVSKINSKPVHKVSRANAFDLMRPRSNSLSTSTNAKR